MIYLRYMYFALSHFFINDYKEIRSKVIWVCFSQLRVQDDCTVGTPSGRIVIHKWDTNILVTKQI